MIYNPNHELINQATQGAYMKLGFRLTNGDLLKKLTIAATSLWLVVTPAQAELVISSSASKTNKTLIKRPLVTEQKPSDASLIKLMQVMHINDQIEAIVNGQKAISSILQAPDAGEENNILQKDAGTDSHKSHKRQREIAESMQGIFQKYGKIIAGGMQETANKEQLTQAYLNAARTHYNQQEVNALIEFYDTAMGQSILDKNPKVTADFMQSVMPDEEHINKTSEQLEDLMPQVKDIIKDIF